MQKSTDFALNTRKKVSYQIKSYELFNSAKIIKSLILYDEKRHYIYSPELVNHWYAIKILTIEINFYLLN